MADVGGIGGGGQRRWESVMASSTVDGAGVDGGGLMWVTMWVMTQATMWVTVWATVWAMTMVASSMQTTAGSMADGGGVDDSGGRRWQRQGLTRMHRHYSSLDQPDGLCQSARLFPIINIMFSIPASTSLPQIVVVSSSFWNNHGYYAFNMGS